MWKLTYYKSQPKTDLLENRLVYFADQPEEKKDPVQEWRETRKTEKPEARVKRLTTQVDKRANGQPPMVLQKIKKILKAGDPDLVDFVDEYLNSGHYFTMSDFFRELQSLEDIKNKDKKTEQATDISGVKEQVINKVISLNETLANLPTTGSAKLTTEINAAIRQNDINITKTNAVNSLITTKPELNFTEAKIQELFRIDPYSEGFSSRLKQLLGPDFCRDNHEFVQQLGKLLKEKQDSENEAERLMILIFDQIKERFDDERHQFEKIRDLQIGTGLPIKKGAVFSFSESGRSGVVEIANINWNTPDNADVEALMLANGQKAYKLMELELEFRSGGTKEKQKMGFRKFLEWSKYHAIVEEFTPSLEILHENLELNLFDQKLQSGDKLEYRIGADKSRLHPVTDIIEIMAIDEATGTIELSKPVAILLSPADNVTEASRNADTKQKLSFGEFARWWRRRVVEFEMNQNQAQSVLNKLPGVLKSRYPEQPDIIDKPINLEVGTKLIVTGNKEVSISAVDDKTITLSNGLELSLGQFVRMAKDYDWEAVEEESGETKSESKSETESKADTETPEVPEADEPDAANDNEDKTDESEEPEPEKDEVRISEPIFGNGPGVIRGIWNSVSFLSLRDLYRIGEVTIDFYTRNHERESKRRVGDAGANLPGRLGREFQNMAQGSEDEAVNKYKEGLDDVSDWDIMDRMYASNNQDEVKAYLMTLTDRGMLRFDDIKMWRTLNRLLDRMPGGSDSKIPIYTYQNRPDEAQDFVKKAMDGIWGSNTGDDFFKKNTGQFDSEVSSFETEARDYENQYKGVSISGELHNMLTAHYNDEPVKPHRYYSFIDYIMKAGKAAVEDKFYYMVMGLYLKNSRGETLLPKRMVATINSYSNQLPFLDFFTRCKPFEDGGTLPPEYLADLAGAFGLFDPKVDGKRYDADAINQYIWQDTLMHSNVHTRASKGSRGAGNIDHDDAHFIIPLNALGDLRQNVLGKQAGERLNYTKDGYKNGVAGFSQMFAAAAASPTSGESPSRLKNGFLSSENVLLKMVPSYLYYMSVLTGKVAGHHADQKIEFLDETAGVDGAVTMREYFSQMNGVIKDVLRAYGFDEQTIAIVTDYEYADIESDTYKQKSTVIQNFGSKFRQRVKSTDGGQKIVDIMREAALSNKISGIEGRGKILGKQKDFANYWESGYESRQKAA